MIPVAANKVLNLFVVVIGYRNALRASGGAIPFIERFVPNYKTHPVAEIEELRCGGIGAGTDGVYRHIAHDLKLTFHRASKESSSERAMVVMQIDPVELDSPAV